MMEALREICSAFEGAESGHTTLHRDLSTAFEKLCGKVGVELDEESFTPIGGGAHKVCLLKLQEAVEAAPNNLNLSDEEVTHEAPKRHRKKPKTEESAE